LADSGAERIDPRVAIASLLEVMRRLRDPVAGCPWDRQQTFATIAPYTLEEAFEVADAIEREDLGALRDELGDLLFQVVFHARLAQEQGAFDFGDVAASIADKLQRRHPHVFAGVRHATAEDQQADWERLKADERRRRGDGGQLGGIARALPALTRARKLGQRAAAVRFDWPAVAGVRDKVAEELAELDAAVAADPGSSHAFEELGDLLFVIANWARHLGHDPEAALRAANAKFERRFGFIERAAAEAGESLEALDAGRWEALWQQAKDSEKDPDRDDP
jgi:MazG family protein